MVTIKELERQLSDSETQARKLQQKAKDEEASRRKLSNAIMDLKGHIRVFCRVRPYGSTDDAVASINYPDLEGREIVLAPTKGPKYPFTFDKVFAATSSQEDIFDEVSYMLPSIMNGGNACVFAYGATQTGKSYTLEGPSSTAEEPLGLIPRSILWIYEATRAPESNDWRYTVEVRHIGIYNETIYDLHAPEGSSTGTKHEIHSIAGNKIIVSGVNMTELKSAVMMGSLLRTAQRRQASIRTSLKDGYYSGHRYVAIGSFLFAAVCCNGVGVFFRANPFCFVALILNFLLACLLFVWWESIQVREKLKKAYCTLWIWLLLMLPQR